MSVVLVTGMSGVGKSTLLRELDRQGFATLDTDYDLWCVEIHGDRVWDERRMALLLAEQRSGVLFVSGTVSNQGQFYDRFDAVVLLSAPRDVLFDRLATRTTNDYGKRKAERGEIAHNILTVEPMLRKSSTHEIDSTAPVETVVARLIRIGADPHS